MKKFIVQCNIYIDAPSEEDAYDEFLCVLKESVQAQDVMLFDFIEVPDQKQGVDIIATSK